MPSFPNTLLVEYQHRGFPHYHLLAVWCTIWFQLLILNLRSDFRQCILVMVII